MFVALGRKMMFLCILFLIQYLTCDLSYALNEPCNSTEPCTLKEKSTCIADICKCDQLSKYNTKLQKCLSYATEYATLCYEDWQCEDFLGDDSQCLNNACLCKTGYWWYRGKCQKYANKGDNCSDDVICLDGSNPLALTCTGSTCQCSEGYYDRGDGCRLKSQKDGACAITSDCFPTPGNFGEMVYSHCELGICIQNSIHSNTTREFNNTFTYSQSSSYLKHLLDINLEDTTTVEPVTKCPNGVSSDLSGQDCLDCPNTLYFNNTTCICDRGFFLQGGKCIAELGVYDTHAQYETDTDCPLKPGKAVNGTCYCRDYWFVDNTNRECKKTTLEYTDNCLDNDWCKPMGPYAYCNTETEKCSCSSQAVLNETSFYCELKHDANISEICLSNAACPLYEMCTDEECQCDEGFYRVNDTSLCLPKIGSSCEVRDCDHIDNAVCSSNESCQCKSEDFVSNGFVCLQTVNELNEECEIQQQCENIPHADCRQVSTSENATSQCLCTDDFLGIEGVCYAVKTFGSQCATLFDCTVILGESFECRKGLCQCPIGATFDKSNVCVQSSAKQLGFYSMLLVILAAPFVL